MPWVRFDEHFDWPVPPHGRVTLSFEPGQVRFVKRAVAVSAVAAGRAVITKRPEPEPTE